jgi:hypothetical protein
VPENVDATGSRVFQTAPLDHRSGLNRIRDAIFMKASLDFVQFEVLQVGQRHEDKRSRRIASKQLTAVLEDLTYSKVVISTG